MDLCHGLAKLLLYLNHQVILGYVYTYRFQIQHAVIPTVDEVILDLNQISYFSQINMKMANHQLEIEEASRPITAFVTRMGVFRNKIPLFGIKSASKHCQKTIQQILQGCEGVKNISDDLIIHGSNLKQHEECYLQF